jgi:hypothetical protein
MALILHNHTSMPLGQFDGYDSQISSFKGGEVCTLVGVGTAGGDLSSADVVQDGYVPGSPPTRPVVSNVLNSNSRPLFLADDGIANYGTLFGTVVGGTVGQTTGPTLGPSTALGSGKITLWQSPGIYGVTLDACDTAADGLVPNSTTTLSVGKGLTWSTAGLLTPVGSTKGTAGGNTAVLCSFIEFATNGSLVTTPGTLVAALNSPSGNVSSAKAQVFSQAVFYYRGAYGV